MAILATQTVVGNIGRVYDLRTVGANNTPVVDFSVAVTPRKKVSDTEWADGETYWVTATAWNKLATNIVESFKPGDRVFVYGRMDMKPGYTNREGVAVDARPIMSADFAGLEVSYAPAESKREARGGSAPRSAAPAAKKAAAPAPAVNDLFAEDDFSFDANDEPPF